MAQYTLIESISEVSLAPPDGILSRALYQDQGVKVVQFNFAAGQELSEHTASVPAILHFLSGQGVLSLGADRHEVKGGAWVHMEAGLAHGIRANTDLVMLLLLLKGSSAEA